MRKFSSSVLMTLALCTLSCDDVFEEDISDDSVTTIAPEDNAVFEGNTVQFRWNALEGADDYRLQITDEELRLVLDSLIPATVFDYQIDPGTYEWRIRAENFAYTTPYTFQSSFSISESIDLTDQRVTLLSPDNNAYFNEVALLFSWQGISTAESYTYQLLEVVTNGETQIFEDDNVLDTSLSLGNTAITEDAEYIWQVRAQNSTSTTDFFKRSFFVDRQAPPVPTLNEPTADENFNVNQAVDFGWNFEDIGDLQSGISGMIEIASDENFNTIVATDTNANDEFTFTFTSVGTYYWRVGGTDEAGNVGDQSDSLSFIIN